MRVLLVSVVVIVGLLSVPAPAVADPESFTIAIIPDTQNESPGTQVAQMAWVESQGFAAVIHEGDVVNTKTSQSEWDAATTAMAPVHELTVANGNHDSLDYRGTPGAYPISNTEFATFVGTLPNYDVGVQMVEGDPSNMYRIFNAGGTEWMLMTLQFGTPDPVIAWAKTVAQAHPQSHIILVTHDYLSRTGTIRTATSYASAPQLNPAYNSPNVLWQQLVKKRKAFQFVFSGHINATTTGLPYATSSVKMKGDAGKNIYAVMTNFQMMPDGGGGFIRTATFTPATKTVEFRTFNPLTGVEYTDGKSRFSFTDVNFGDRS